MHSNPSVINNDASQCANKCAAGLSHQGFGTLIYKMLMVPGI